MDREDLVENGKAVADTKVKRPDRKILVKTDDPDYIDFPEKETRRSGAQTHHLLPQISVLCKMATDIVSTEPTHVRCIASRECHEKWAIPRNCQRIFRHVKNCSWVPGHLIASVTEALATNGNGPEPSVTHSASSTPEPFGGSRWTTSRSQGIPITEQPSVHSYFSAQGRKDLKANGDHALMCLVVNNSLSANIVDSPEFKDYSMVLNPTYQPASSQVLNDKLIPVEAARIRVAILKYLRTCRNLTISFDGGKVRRPQAVYTVHATTPDRRTFILELDDAGGLSHTAHYIVDLLDRVSPKVSQQ